MTTFAQVKASNDAHFSSLSSAPVAVFVGGTSGIGEAMVYALARYTQGNANIVIIGRNKEAGERILSELPKPSSEGEEPIRLFIQCDVSLMRNVQSTIQQLTSSLLKINYLILSTGFLDISDRRETKEGMELRLAVSYYSRWLFTRELIGLVEKAKESGEEGTVMSILAPGFGGEIDPNDWELKKNYSSMRGIAAASTYNDLMVEAFADNHPNIPFIHVHPGFVRTPIFRNSPSYLVKLTGFIVSTIGRLFTISGDECAEWMWSIVASVNDGKGTGGSYRMNPHGKDLEKTTKYYGDEEKRKGLWEHTEAIIGRSLKAQV
jgi:NAD(P)-dependent dehydrogenase (short-subunit alcohol dehydrogenase family)